MYNGENLLRASGELAISRALRNGPTSLISNIVAWWTDVSLGGWQVDGRVEEMSP